MKKTIVLFSAVLFAFVLVFTLSSCSGDDSDTLYVYNWGEYISDGSEDTLDVNKAFEEYYLETYGKKITVNYSTFSSNEDMYAKISSGAVSYDVIFPSDYMIERLIKENLLAELNYDNIPNYSHIFDSFKGENAFYDPQNKYTVPYAYGMVGIIYNTTLVDEADAAEQSWGLMWNEKYSGEILQFNNSRDAFGTALYYLGYDVNDATEEQWKSAKDKLLEQKPLVQAYVMDEIYNKMKGASASIASYYAGDYIMMYEDNNDLEFYYPKEGTNYYVDAMCIPSSSKNKELAERYINFMLSEEPAIANAEYTYYATPNDLVVNNEEYQEYMNDIKENAIDLLYGQFDSVPTSAYRNLSSDRLALINELWEELKIVSDVGTGIYIFGGIIAAALIAVIVVMVVRKKKREKLAQ